MLSQAKNPQLRCGLFIGQDPVIIPGAALVSRRPHPHAMFAQLLAQDHKQRRDRACEQSDGEPGPKAEQDSRHGQKRDAALEQAAKILHQGQRAVACFKSGPVQVVIEFRGIIESEIQGDGLLVDEALDVILEEFGLGGADPAGKALQGICCKEHRSHEKNQNQGGQEIVPRPSSSCRCGQAVNERSGQVNRCHGEQSLHQHEHSPGEGPGARCMPDENQSP